METEYVNLTAMMEIEAHRRALEAIEKCRLMRFAEMAKRDEIERKKSDDTEGGDCD